MRRRSVTLGRSRRGPDEGQRRILGEALDACDGRIYGHDGAAARLGLRPTTLQSKLAKLGLARDLKGSRA